MLGFLYNLQTQYLREIYPDKVYLTKYESRTCVNCGVYYTKLRHLRIICIHLRIILELFVRLNTYIHTYIHTTCTFYIYMVHMQNTYWPVFVASLVTRLLKKQTM